MKKLLAIILILCMIASVLALAACESTQDPKETSSETEATVDNGKTDGETDGETNGETDGEANGETGGETNGEAGGEANGETESADTESTTNGGSDSTASDDGNENVTDSDANATKEEATYLGKAPAELYAEAFTRLNSATNYTVLCDALMESSASSYYSTRLINAKISGNTLYAYITTDYDDETKKKEEHTWIVDGMMYQNTTYGAKNSESMSDADAASIVGNFKMNYMIVFFNLTSDHFGDARFSVTGDTATVTVAPTAAQLSALTGEDYTIAKSSECEIAVTFDANGNITNYFFDWTVVRDIDGQGEATEHMKYNITFSDIGTTTVTAPEDADSYVSSDGGTSSNGDSSGASDVNSPEDKGRNN